MTGHLATMVLFAACVSAVFGALGRPTRRQQLQLAIRLFAGLTLGAYLLGWILFLAFP